MKFYFMTFLALLINTHAQAAFVDATTNCPDFYRAHEENLAVYINPTRASYDRGGDAYSVVLGYYTSRSGSFVPVHHLVGCDKLAYDDNSRRITCDGRTVGVSTAPGPENALNRRESNADIHRGHGFLRKWIPNNSLRIELIGSCDPSKRSLRRLKFSW